jgi:hypothetical protein
MFWLYFWGILTIVFLQIGIKCGTRYKIMKYIKASKTN